MFIFGFAVGFATAFVLALVFCIGGGAIGARTNEQ